MRTRSRIISGLAATFFGVAACAAEPLAVDLERVSTGSDQRTGEPVLNIVLKESSRRPFAIFSGNNIGRRVQLRVDGKVLHSSAIREPMLSGSFQLSGISLPEAQALAEELSKPGIKVEVDDAAE